MALPAVVLAAGLDALRTYAPGPGRPGSAVVNRIERPDAAAWVDEHLREVDPEVVVVGNSLGAFDIDPALLGGALGVDPERVAVLSVPGSVASHWAALLGRMVAGGHRPGRVIVVGDLQSALSIRPRTPAGRAHLDALLAHDLPELRARIAEGSGWPAIDAVEVNRGRARRDLVDRIRAAPVALLAPDDVRNPLGWARDRVTRAGTRVFHERDLAVALTREVRTGFDERYQVTDPGELLAPADSLVPELRALAEAAGARLVYVRPPLSPQTPPFARDVVPPGTEARMAAELGAPHAYLDAAGLLLGLPAYVDLVHLGKAGARKFTVALAERLHRLDDPAPPTGLAGAPEVLGPVPELAPRPGEKAFGGTTSWLLPQVGRVHEELWAMGLAPPEDCVPVEVAGPDGPLARMSCGELFPSERPGSCFDGERLFARAPAGLAPEALFLVASARRACGDFLWMYPGDRVRLQVPGQGPLRVAATGDAPPELALRVDGAPAALAPLAPWSRDEAPGTLVLEGPAGGSSVELENTSADRLVVVWRVGR